MANKVVEKRAKAATSKKTATQKGKTVQPMEAIPLAEQLPHAPNGAATAWYNFYLELTKEFREQE